MKRQNLRMVLPEEYELEDNLYSLERKSRRNTITKFNIQSYYIGPFKFNDKY